MWYIIVCWTTHNSDTFVITYIYDLCILFLSYLLSIGLIVGTISLNWNLYKEKNTEGKSFIIRASMRSKATTKIRKWEGRYHKTSSIIAYLRPVRLGWVAFAKHWITIVWVSRSISFDEYWIDCREELLVDIVSF